MPAVTGLPYFPSAPKQPHNDPTPSAGLPVLGWFSLDNPMLSNETVVEEYSAAPEDHSTAVWY